MSTATWNHSEIQKLFERPFLDLLFAAQTVHKAHFNNDEIEICTLLNIKTGACPEDCSYCPQSAHYQTGLQREKLWDLEEVIASAKNAKEAGAKRFCMGAAWRNPPKKDFPKVIDMIKAVKNLGLEACVTLGMLDQEQALQLQAAGLDFYNHNLDTSPEFFPQITTTRTYQDRLDTLTRVRDAGINVCCGGIMGMGETREDRINFLLQLVSLPEPPKSVPINRLIRVKGTPLEKSNDIDNIEFIRVIAAARIMMPNSMIRLSAGREDMSEEMHALCFMAGANSIFLGEKLLTTKNRDVENDSIMLKKFGMRPKQ